MPEALGCIKSVIVIVRGSQMVVDAVLRDEIHSRSWLHQVGGFLEDFGERVIVPLPGS